MNGRELLVNRSKTESRSVRIARVVRIVRSFGRTTRTTRTTERPNDPNDPSDPDRPRFCLRAVHQKFTTVHSPDTQFRATRTFRPDLERHGRCSSGGALRSSRAHSLTVSTDSDQRFGCQPLGRLQMHKGVPLTPLVLWVLAFAAGACGSTVATSTGPSPAKCAVTVAVPTSPVSSGGDTATVGLTTQPECAWSASSDAAWITGLAPSSGQGSAQLQIQVAANPDGTARHGDVIVNGQRARIRQDAAACRFELSTAEQTVPATGGIGRITFTAAAGCAWSAQADAAWVELTGGTTGTGAGSVAYAIASNPGTSTRSASIVVAGQTLKVTQQADVAVPPPACSVTVTPRDVTLLASGANNSSISVTAAASCNWSASSDASWISLTGRTSGTGSGTVTFSVASNSGVARSGQLTIGDQTVSVNQAATDTCSYTVTPLTTSVVASGGAGPQVTIDTQTGCAWTVASNATWLSITSATGGSGDTSVSFNASTNPGAARSGTLTVAGQTVTVSQPSASCSYSASPPTISIAAGGSTGSAVSVTASAGCAWTAGSNVSWISIASGASGTGNGTVTIAVAANSSAARSGTVTIAGQTVTVNQAAAPCTFSLSSTTLSVAAGGGATGPVAVTTGAGCTWTATSNASSWLSITAGASGTGNGGVSINAAANTGAARTGTLTVANQTVTVNQAGCSYSVTPTTASIGAAGGTGTSISVSAGSGCIWTATTSAGWITILTGANGTGNGNVTYSVQANTGSARTGTLTVAGQSVTISQSAAPCTYSISPMSKTGDKAGGTGTVSVTTQAGCTWMAVSNASWITITSGSSGTGNGAVAYTVAANTTGNERTGTLTIAGHTFTFTEKK